MTFTLILIVIFSMKGQLIAFHSGRARTIGNYLVLRSPYKPFAKTSANIAVLNLL